MIYLNSQHISKKLGINLAKWKRWSREFLDPDPLGGFQSGYARQFSIKDAFRVYLGGYLVADLKFTIAETRQILSDLQDWLTKNHIYSLPVQPAEAKQTTVSHHIYIHLLDEGKFGYAIRRMAGHSLEKIGSRWQERFDLQLIGLPQASAVGNGNTHARVLYINTLYDKFLLMVEG